MRQSISNSGIDANRIDRRAKSVLGRLRSAGFDAWIVGGAVRDLLLGRQPKDFDVATDALPEEICSVFHRARVVGRRFRIVHVQHGRHLTEVSTYRTSIDKDQAKVASSFEEMRGQARVVSADGVLLRDNAWGNQQEDALRRDFTINAFYYDPFGDELVDFCGGYADLERKSLRLIGHPEQRFIEDPVRILRALRIASKLGLSIERETARAMRTCKDMIEKVSPRRKYDECVKLLMNGHAESSWDLTEDFGLIELLFPTAAPRDGVLIRKALQNTDLRVSEDRPVTFAFLLSVVYFSEYQLALARQPEDQGFESRHTEASNHALNELRDTMAIPRYASMFAREVWALQERLESCRKAKKTLALERFRAAYDLLHLRVEAGGADQALRDWWQAYQEGSPSLPKVAARGDSRKDPADSRARRYGRARHRRARSG